MRWLITNRNLTKTGFGIEFVWLHDKLTANTWDWSAWSQVTKDAFKAALVTAADQFPPPLTTSLDQQKQVTLLIHGCNNAWDAAMRLHDRVERNLYSGVTGFEDRTFSAEMGKAVL